MIYMTNNTKRDEQYHPDRRTRAKSRVKLMRRGILCRETESGNCVKGGPLRSGQLLFSICIQYV